VSPADASRCIFQDTLLSVELRSLTMPLFPVPCVCLIRRLAGSQVVVAESYARIFFRNCMSTGELYPVETDLRVCDELKTGATAVVISLAMLLLCCVML
jgi:hypothetical protein